MAQLHTTGLTAHGQNRSDFGHVGFPPDPLQSIGPKKRSSGTCPSSLTFFSRQLGRCCCQS